MFVKSGSENYILGKAQFPVPEGEQINIVVMINILKTKKINDNFY